MKVLILGASYGSLLGTKLLLAGHDVTLVCRPTTAALINSEGTVCRMTLKGDTQPTLLKSKDMAGHLDAAAPADVVVEQYALVALAMQEPQYSEQGVKELMGRIAAARLPCLSIMNMPPPPFLRRIPAIAEAPVTQCFADCSLWDAFIPGLISLCSPDPQAYRPPEEAPNFLHVNLPTNFKAAPFEDPQHTALLTQLEKDIDAITLEGKDVPVKLRVHSSLFAPLAKWSMLLAGNYRCITATTPLSIRDTVHGDLEASRRVYEWVDALARKLGAAPEDQVPFEKYAAAAKQLQSPSSVARALAGGATAIERVDLLVQQLGRHLGDTCDIVDSTVNIVSECLTQNKQNISSDPL